MVSRYFNKTDVFFQKLVISTCENVWFCVINIRMAGARGRPQSHAMLLRPHGENVWLYQDNTRLFVFYRYVETLLKINGNCEKCQKMDCWVKYLEKLKSNRSKVSNTLQNRMKLILSTTGSHLGKV